MTPLWDAVFGTTPPAVAKSGELTLLTLGGRTYDAWVWGEGTVQIGIYALHGVPWQRKSELPQRRVFSANPRSFSPARECVGRLRGSW